MNGSAARACIARLIGSDVGVGGRPRKAAATKTNSGRRGRDGGVHWPAQKQLAKLLTLQQNSEQSRTFQIGERLVAKTNQERLIRTFFEGVLDFLHFGKAI